MSVRWHSIRSARPSCQWSLEFPSPWRHRSSDHNGSHWHRSSALSWSSYMCKSRGHCSSLSGRTSPRDAPHSVVSEKSPADLHIGLLSLSGPYKSHHHQDHHPDYQQQRRGHCHHRSRSYQFPSSILDHRMSQRSYQDRLSPRQNFDDLDS